MSDNVEDEKKPLKFWVSFAIQAGVGIALILGVFFFRQTIKDTTKDLVRAWCDAASIIGIMYLCVGILATVSVTGFFDVFGFAFKRALHGLIPGMTKDLTGNYYEYCEEKKLKRGQKYKSYRIPLILGVLFIAVGLVLTYVWYQL